MKPFSRKPRPRVDLCSDTYCRSQAAKWKGVLDAIALRRPRDRAVLVVSHFTETFTELQDRLMELGMAHEVLATPLGPDALLARVEQLDAGVVVLALAQAFTADGRPTRAPAALRLSLIGVERHPLRRHDLNLLEFARSLLVPVRMGYYVALDDASIRPFVGDWIPMLLEQWGMRDNELITSHLVGRRLDQMRRKIERRAVSDLPADSASEWLRLNDPQFHQPTGKATR